MHRPAVASILLGVSLGLMVSPTQAQAIAEPSRSPVYGTSWGVASYGLKRTSSSYSSPFGLGYSYGTTPQGFVPGRFGADLWRPNGVAPAGVYGVPNRYRTFPYPYPAGPPVYGPSIGVYAPGFGAELRSPSAW